MAAALGVGDAFVARDPLGPVHGKSLVRIRPVFFFRFLISDFAFRVSLFGFWDSGFPRPATIPSLRISSASLSCFGGVSGFGFRGSSFGFRVLSFGFRVSGFGLRVSSFGLRVSGFGLRSRAFVFWFRISGFGFRDSGFCLLVSGFWFLSSGFGLRVSGFGIRDLFMRFVLSLLLASSSDPCKSRV